MQFGTLVDEFHANKTRDDLFYSFGRTDCVFSALFEELKDGFTDSIYLRNLVSTLRL